MSGYEPGPLPLLHNEVVVVGWFRSTSPRLAFGLVRSHYATTTRLISAPSPFGFSIAHIRHIHFFDVSIFLNIIGLFRSTVLRVMSPTRFLCATMMGLSFGGFDPPPPKPVGALAIVLQWLVSLGGFDPPPPTLFGMLPLHLNDSFDKCPAVAHICHRLHYVPINHINNFFYY